MEWVLTNHTNSLVPRKFVVLQPDHTDLKSCNGYQITHGNKHIPTKVVNMNQNQPQMFLVVWNIDLHEGLKRVPLMGIT